MVSSDYGAVVQSSDYASISHGSLYRMLHDGDPGKVKAAAAEWRTLSGWSSNLSEFLSTDLDSLKAIWTGPAFDEYVRRLESIASYGQRFSTSCDAMAQMLDDLAAPLADAISKSEPPPNPHHEQSFATDGSVAGTVAGPGGSLILGLIGKELGHHLDEGEKQRAHDRMVAVVNELVVEYDARGGAFSAGIVPPPPPVELPQGVSGFSSAQGWRSAIGTSATSSTTAGAGVGTARTAVTTGAGLSGAQVPNSAGTSGVVVSSHSTSSNVSDAGVLGVPGLIATVGLPASVRSAAGPSPVRTGLAGAHNAAKPVSPRVLGGNEALPERAVTSLTIRDDSRGGGTGTGRGAEDGEQDARSTWLTEDDMVWADDVPVAPQVLGKD